LKREKAAAYTDGRQYPWGNEFDASKVTYNDRGTRSVSLNPEGKSPEGIYDLSGNVWEWTDTWYGEIDFTDPKNPKFPDKGEYLVLRGGSWGHYGSPAYLSSAIRGKRRPEGRYNNVGFRVVGDLK
jgi:iron(II)-dependent oxidoreductase